MSPISQSSDVRTYVESVCIWKGLTTLFAQPSHEFMPVGHLRAAQTTHNAFRCIGSDVSEYSEVVE